MKSYLFEYRCTFTRLVLAVVWMAPLAGCLGTAGTEDPQASEEVSVTMSRQDITHWDQTVQSLQTPTPEGLSRELGLTYFVSSQTSMRADLTSTDRVEFDDGVILVQSLFAYLVDEPSRYLLSFELDPGGRCVTLEELRKSHPGLQLTQAPSGHSPQERYVYKDGTFEATFKQTNWQCLASFGRVTL